MYTPCAVGCGAAQPPLLSPAAAIEAKCKTARAQVERLTPAILAKAFRGELLRPLVVG